MNSFDLISLAVIQIVQVTLSITAAAFLSFGCLRRRPTLAAAVWLAVLCKCATPPVWASPLGVFSWLRVEPPRIQTPVPSWIKPAQAATQSNTARIEPAASPTIVRTPPLPWSSLWPWLLAGVWATGFAWTLGRVYWRRRRWLAAVVESYAPRASLIHAVAERSRRLGVAPPRIVMVAADAGPAVSGWFRPTIYLPVGADPVALEPMLVHELIHLRRRDPWLGALQALVCAAYWFHPGVRWASAELSRCIEEACDAQAVRELGCRPADYAAVLVALLERRVAPPSVPVVAGMSPAQSVRRRLQAVMTTNPKRRGSSARGPWLAFAAATLIALPGAGLPPGPPPPEQKPAAEGTILPNPVMPPTAVAVSPVGPPPPKPSIEPRDFHHRGYDLKPAIDALVKHAHLTEDAARNAVVNLALAGAERIGPRPVFTIADQRLFAFATDAQHQWMASALASTIDALTLDQIVIENEIWDAPKAVLDALTSERHVSDGTVTVPEITFLTEADYTEISKRLLAEKSANKVAGPKFTTMGGQKVAIKFVTDYPAGGKRGPDGKPPTVPVGYSLDVVPTVSADRQFVRLRLRYEEGDLSGFVPQLPRAPIVNQRVTETTFTTPWGNRAAVRTSPSKLLVFKSSKAPPPDLKFNTQPPGDGRLSANADPKLYAAMEWLGCSLKEGGSVVRVYPVEHLLRGGAPTETQLEHLGRVLNDVLIEPKMSDDRGMAPTIQVFRPNRTLVVCMPPRLHEHLSRILRDIDPRTSEEKTRGIPQEHVTPPAAGN